MSFMIRFLRITFFLLLYFVICMVVVITMLQGWPDGGQMLFAFGVPVILVWWQEKRRSWKVAAKALAEGNSNTPISQASPSAQAYIPPKQNYAKNVRAGESATPALAVISGKKRPARVASTTSARSTKNGWIPSGETARVADRTIGGMVYVGTPPLLNTYGYHDKCRAYTVSFGIRQRPTARTKGSFKRPCANEPTPEPTSRRVHP